MENMAAGCCCDVRLTAVYKQIGTNAALCPHFLPASSARTKKHTALTFFFFNIDHKPK
jgi:hypothetical protein